MPELLHVHVVWHPRFRQGKRYADAIFAFFRRDPANPIIRGLGLPVQVWTAETRDGDPPDVAALKLDDAKHNAVFILFDPQFADDERWKTFATNIQQSIDARGGSDRMLVALTDNTIGQKLPANMGGGQGIQLWGDVKSLKQKIRKVVVRGSVALARALVSADEQEHVAKLFLSHAKQDEYAEPLAAAFRDYVRQSAPFQSFYDAQDLIAGESWEKQLRNRVKQSAVVVFQTDAYSGRPVCQLELLEARYADRPIINVHAVKNGELRVFPYLGNVPSLRYAGKVRDRFGVLLEVVTFEVLRAIYLRQKLSAVKRRDKSLKKLRILFRPPDLVACASFREPGFLYPDPPLGPYELDLLRKLDAKRVFVTPDSRPLAGATV